MIEIFLIGLICHIGSGNSITRAALVADSQHVAGIGTKRYERFFAPQEKTHSITFEVAANPSDVFKDGPATAAPNFDLVPHLRSTTDGTIRSVVERGDTDSAVAAYIEYPVGVIEAAKAYPLRARYIIDRELRYEGCVARFTRFSANVSGVINLLIDGVVVDSLQPGDYVQVVNVRLPNTAMPAHGDFMRHLRLLDTTNGALVIEENRACVEKLYCNLQDCHGVFENSSTPPVTISSLHPENDTSVECANSHWP